MAVSKGDEGINFLYTLKRGRAEGSFGIYVAKRAGLPEEVIQRSQEILASFDKQVPILEKVYQESEKLEWEKAFRELQEFLEGIDIAQTTPLQALLLLAEIKEKVREKSKTIC
jgi:Mismatch repair ATPase (MutS family)